MGEPDGIEEGVCDGVELVAAVGDMVNAIGGIGEEGEQEGATDGLPEMGGLLIGEKVEGVTVGVLEEIEDVGWTVGLLDEVVGFHEGL